MSDTHGSGPHEKPNTPPLTPTTAESGQVTVVPPAAADPDDGRKPLGPHVFGKRLGFFITAVPLLFYLAGNAASGWLEDSRVHTCVKEQATQVKFLLEKTRVHLKDAYANEPGGFERYWNDWNLAALESLTDPTAEEDYEAEKLEKLLGPIRDESQEPEFEEKIALRQSLNVLLEMKELEHEHKNREVLALSHRLKTEGLELDLDEEKSATDSATSTKWFPDDQTWYPATYTIVIGITALLMLLAFPGYFRAPFKLTIWSVIVGVVGIFVWIGLVELDRNFLHIGEMLGFGSRAAFNPFEELKSNPTWMYQFMAIRFAGLVLVVPFIEEFFIRGWLMRYIDDPDWDQMPLAEHGALAIGGVVVYAICGHPAELLAAAVWFSMVTWLFLKTKSIWDCVLAHAITNLLLGLFVIYTNSWHLW